MNLKHQIRAEFWALGKEPVSCTVSRADDGRVRFSRGIGDERGHLFLITESGARYGMGEFEVRDGLGLQMESLAVARSQGLEQGAGHSVVDSTSVKRISNLLARTAGIRLELKLPGEVLDVRTVAKIKGSVASFFICEYTGGSVLESVQDVPAVLFLFGMLFVFRAHILEAGDGQVALAFPSSLCRIVGRSSVREDAAIEISLGSGQGERRMVAANISYSGLRVVDEQLRNLPAWSEVDLQLHLRGRMSGEETIRAIRTQALIVGQSENGTHLQFDGSAAELKQRFYSIHSYMNQNVELEEDAESAWQCLEKFGYMQIMEPGLLEKTRARAVADWQDASRSDLWLLPVLKKNEETLGTYGTFCGGIKNWYHHVLCLQFHPSSMTQAAILYQAWPAYVLSRFEPSWVTAWYDPTKTWHNRFCQIFINEHKAHPESVTYDRHCFWLPDIQSQKLAPSLGKISFELLAAVPDETREKSLLELKQWYPKFHSVMTFPKEERASDDGGGAFLRWESNICIMSEGVHIGNLLLSQMKADLNPLSIANSANINIFDPLIRQSPDRLVDVISETVRLMERKGYQRGFFSIDYDASYDAVKQFGFHYISLRRCLTFSSRLLPDWMANNSLNFADLTGRISA